ncbi:MAG: crossover junction endodeoxyribonuclease RuvC [Pseudomonadota bacterium]
MAVSLRTTGADLRILGLDPGTASTGWGVIGYAAGKARLLAHGVISTSSHEPSHERLDRIHRGVLAVIDEFQPTAAAIEELFGGINLKTALAVGQARGVIALACAQRGIAPADYTPLRIKQAVVGYGRADKAQVQQMVKALLALPKIPRPDHAADALAVAICHAHSMSLDYRKLAAGAPG